MALIPPTPTDRLRGAFLALVRAVAPQLLYLGTYEYKVLVASPPSPAQSQVGGLTWVVSAIPADAALLKILPPVANITLWPGPVWGYTAILTPGQIVRMSFVNGDPSKPAIVGLDPSTPATPASPVFLGSAAGKPLVGAAALAVAITNASSAAASAAVPGDGGKVAFTTFASSMALETAGYSTKIVMGS